MKLTDLSAQVKRSFPAFDTVVAGFDTFIVKHLQDNAPKFDKLAYSPFEIEQLASQSIQQLGLLVELRDDILELEVQAIRASFEITRREYELTQAREKVGLDKRKQMAQAVATAENGAMAAFQKTAGTIESGLASEAEGKRNVATLDSTQLDEFKRLDTAMLDFQDTELQKQTVLYEDPASALSFPTRRQRQMRLFGHVLIGVVQRLQACIAGLNHAYNAGLEMPPLDKNDYFEELYLLVYKVRDKVDDVTLFRQSGIVVINLLTDVHGKGSLFTGKWQTPLFWSFNISNDTLLKFIPTLGDKEPRLLAFDVRFGIDAEVMNRTSFWHSSYSISTVHTPLAAVRFSNFATKADLEWKLQGVGHLCSPVFTSPGTPTCSPVRGRHISPYGDWRIAIAGFGTGGAGFSFVDGGSPPEYRDCKLILKLSYAD